MQTQIEQARGFPQAEVRYRALVERIPAITYIAALDDLSTILYVSPQAKTILGYSPEEWTANPQLWSDRLHPDDCERVMAELQRSHAGGEPFRCEYRMLSRDGRAVWFRDEAAVVQDDDGQPLFIQGIMLDITERKQVEEENAHTQTQLLRQ